ncbi:MAG TPA: hypothetical protein EYF98_14100, partial [Planctomycetes bacterium]|nr:hypothetical protein [Planctomycetota bacterium]
MALIRRQAGRRSVAGKLDEIKKSRASRDPAMFWDVFVLNVLVWWLTGHNQWTLAPRAAPAAEAAFRLQGSTRFDKAIPWLWREWRLKLGRTPNASNLYATDLANSFRNTQVRDWYRELRPNLAPLTWSQAVSAARDWHANTRAVAEGVLPVRHRGPFTKVKKFALGFFIAEYRSDGTDPRGEPELQALGKILGHCYAFPNNAKTYAEEYDLWTLFDKDWVPHWTAATTGPRSDQEHEVWGDIWGLAEVKGANNMPVRPEHFRYLENLLGHLAHDQDDYHNAKGLYDNAEPGTVRHVKGANAIEFTGKDGRTYRVEMSDITEGEFSLLVKDRHLWQVLAEHGAPGHSRWSSELGPDRLLSTIDDLFEMAHEIDASEWP